MSAIPATDVFVKSVGILRAQGPEALADHFKTAYNVADDDLQKSISTIIAVNDVFGKRAKMHGALAAHGVSFETATAITDALMTLAQNEQAQQNAEPVMAEPVTVQTEVQTVADASAEAITLNGGTREVTPQANPTVNIEPFIERALKLADLGIPITPLMVRSKDAFLKGWQTSATTDKAIISTWGQLYPANNIGAVATGQPDGVWFFEVDDAKVLDQILAETGHDLVAEVPTFIVRSRPGRGHFYFRNTAASIAMGNIPQAYGQWSVRQRKAYVVAAGSIHPESGQLYEAVNNNPVAPAPDWLINWLLAQKNKAKTTTAKDGERNDGGLIPHGFIHSWMVSQAGRMRSMGMEIPDIEEQLLKLVHANCEPPINEEKVRQCARSMANYEPNASALLQMKLNQQADAASLPFKYPAIQGSYYDFVVSPLLGSKDGWFPLGSVSIVGGSSGSNKSTWMLELLHKQFHAEDVWGHATNSRRYLVLMVDRGEGSHVRTMSRLGFSREEIPTKFLSPAVVDHAALTEILDRIESVEEMPEVVFLEGADMLVEDASKGRLVAAFMSGLQRIAEHYHIAIVLSVGAPKMRIGEGYTAKRDSILGSEKWSRMSETVVAMQFVEGDDTDNRRSCFVLLRNGPAESFNLKMMNGRLVPDTDPRPKKNQLRADDRLPEVKRWYLELFSDGQGGFKKEISLKEHRKAELAASLPEKTMKRARRELGIDYNHSTKVFEFLFEPPTGADLNAPQAA